MKRNQISTDKYHKLIKKVLFIFLLVIGFSESFLFSLSKANNHIITRKKVLYNKKYELNYGSFITVGRIYTYDKFSKKENYRCVVEGPGPTHGSSNVFRSYSEQWDRGPISFLRNDTWREYEDFLAYVESEKVTNLEIYDGGRRAIVEIETNANYETEFFNYFVSDLRPEFNSFKVELPGLTPELINTLKKHSVDYKIKEGKVYNKKLSPTYEDFTIALRFIPRNSSFAYRFDNNEIIYPNPNPDYPKRIQKNSGLFRIRKGFYEDYSGFYGAYIPYVEWSKYKRLYVNHFSIKGSDLHIYDLKTVINGYKVFRKCLNDIRNK